MKRTKERRAPGGASRSAWIRGAVLAGLLFSGRAFAITSQDFQNPGTPYTVLACTGTPAAPAVLAGGPGGTGNFLRLLTTADTSASNSVSFDRTDGGGFTQATADFDFRITSGVGRGEGFGFALLNTGKDQFMTTGGVSGPAEEPNIAGSLGIGFDIHQDATVGDINNNHLSVHWNSVMIGQYDAGAIDLASGQWIHATIVARPGGGHSDVAVTLTPLGGTATVVVPTLTIPGMAPYEARAYFCAANDTETANYDLANVQIHFTADPSVLGQWSASIPLPIVPIHSVMMPSGRIICWDRGSNGGTDTNPRLLDPTNNFAAVKTSFPGVEIFCSGMTLRSDGQLIQAGGHLSQDGDGRITSFTYNEGTDTWTQLQNMNLGRWYPTLINLNNGDSVVMSGTYSTSSLYNTLPQVMQAATGTWRDLTGAVRQLALFPMLHLAPNGKVYLAGPVYDTYYLDTSGTGSWSAGVGNSHETSRNYGNSVLYGTGKIVLIGGGNDGPPVPAAQSVHNSAEVINLTDATPAWRLVAPMSYRRRHQSALLLPDGTILVTGGTPTGPAFNDATNANLAAELWDPVSETWSVLAGAAYFRIYHSETVLLQDGRVASLGGGHPAASSGGYDNYNLEVYSPPYLFKGPRPTLTSAPASVIYGQSFTASSPDAASITDVTLLALNAMTHAFDMNQRILHPTFAVGSGGLTVTAPSDPNLCPPGYYQLFLLMNGVPSTSKILRIAAPLPPVAIATVNSAASATVSATGPTGASVQLNGSASTDPQNNIASYQWYDGTTLIATGATPTVVLGLGVHTIQLTVTDGAGLTNSTSVQVTVTDTTPPVIQTLSAVPNLLRSVSDVLVPITVSSTATDLVDPAPTVQISGVTSNEADPTGNPGDLSPDFQVTPPLGLNLRSERFTYVRVYTVTVTATDASGNTASSSVPVRVRGKWFP